jgi:hypothetical protein
VNDQLTWLTWIIFVGTYAGLALGKVPGLRMDVGMHSPWSTRGYC